MAIGRGALIGANSFLLVPPGHRAGVVLHIGDRVRMNTASVSAVESVVLEEGVSIARGVYISDHSHGFTDPHLPVRDQPIDRIAPVRVGAGSWIGQNSVVLPGVRIGRGCVIGANSVVRESVPDRTVVAGAPARVLRTLTQADEGTAGGR